MDNMGTGLYGKAAAGLLFVLIGLLFFSQSVGWAMIAAKCVYSLLFLLFVILGAVWLTGNGASFIPRFRGMPAEEQGTYDKPAFCRFLGKMMLILALFWIPISSFIWLRSPCLLISGAVLFLGAVFFTWIYINTKHRFRK